MGGTAALKRAALPPWPKQWTKKLIVLLLWLGYEDVLVRI
jgi:hypothetical protein